MNAITKTVQKFHEFLVKSWPTLDSSKELIPADYEIESDWLQANWEILVEYSLSIQLGKNIFLPVYGFGAGINGDSSRITLPASKPSHSLIVNNANNPLMNAIDNRTISCQYLIFDSFVENVALGFYPYKLPFGFMKCYSEDTEFKIAFDNSITFDLVNLSN